MPRIQNPPFIPTFAIASFIAFFRNTRLIMDWHNFGHSIYALKLGSSHPLVLIYQWYELHAARFATAHFTVTNAMARVLKEDAGIVAHPLHDRPPEYFQPLSDVQRAAFLQKFEPTRGMLPVGRADRKDRLNTRLLVSSTSWTPDEDFSLLLDALVEYSSRSSQGKGLPEIIAVITGKGSQKEHYLSQIKSLVDEGKLKRVSIHTAWLSMADYASLLGSADLGVSLHTSSSGVDLPMKVVDMFGTGLPVVGWSKFEAWPELVQEGINGRGFGRATELAELLLALFENDGAELQTLRKGALKECDKRWDSEWDPIAGRILGLVD
jgi:beta-1,4-mannosyltransferase